MAGEEPTTSSSRRERRPHFYLVYTGFLARLKELDKVTWESSRVGNRAGPFVAPHLPSLGVTMTSLGSGFPREAPGDRYVYKHDGKHPLRDFDGVGASFLLISTRAKAIIDRFASNAVDIAPADVFVRRNGVDQRGGEYWLCDVIRFEDAVDEGASQLDWHPKLPQYTANSRFVFKPDLPPDLHLFRLWNRPAPSCAASRLGK